MCYNFRVLRGTYKLLFSWILLFQWKLYWNNNPSGRYNLRHKSSRHYPSYPKFNSQKKNIYHYTTYIMGPHSRFLKIMICGI